MSLLLAGLTVLVPPQRYEKRQLEDEQILRERIVSLASQCGRYGYRRVTAMLRNEGWLVNHKCVERIWRQEGQFVEVSTPSSGCIYRSTFPVSSGGASPKVGTIRGT